MSHTYPRKPPSPERSSRSQKELRDRYWNTILSNPPGFQPNSDSHGGRISSKQGGSAGHGSTSASMSSNPKGSSSHSESTTGRGKSSRSTPPKPFRCSACPRSFERQGHLDSHVIAVHKLEQPYVCNHDDCGRPFSHRSSLFRHVKGIHEKKRQDVTRGRGYRSHGSSNSTMYKGYKPPES